MGKKLNIIVIGRCMPESDSSYGKFEFEQAVELASKGHNVCFLFSDNRSIKYIRRIYRADCEVDGVRALGITVPFGGVPYKLFNVLKTRCLEAELSKACQSGVTPDVVYAHFPLISMTPKFFEGLVNKGVPVVTMEHWTKVKNKTLDNGRAAFLKLLCEKSRKVCCVSEDLGKAISEQSGLPMREIAVIPNAVNADDFYFRNNRIKNECCQFIWSGRLERNKSVDLILRALSQARRPWRLILAGAGSQDRALKDLADALGIAGMVEFKGWVTPKELGELYRKSDCFISASADETFCVPFAEAWMCGIPCIGVRSNPLRHYFADWNGTLFEDGSEASLLNSIEWIVDRGFNAELISNWANKEFSSKRVIEKVENVLNSASIVGAGNREVRK